VRVERVAHDSAMHRFQGDGEGDRRPGGDQIGRRRSRPWCRGREHFVATRLPLTDLFGDYAT
jgi:hypothetical protein